MSSPIPAREEVGISISRIPVSETDLQAHVIPVCEPTLGGESPAHGLAILAAERLDQECTEQQDNQKLAAEIACKKRPADSVAALQQLTRAGT